jgi:hypothetical protein
MINIELKGKTMRINEFKQPAEEALFEESTTKQVLDVVLTGDQAWSQPMSLEQAIAITLGQPVQKNAKKQARSGNPNVRTNQNL